MLSICLFGSPEVLSGSDPVRIPRRKSRALLYYLAAHERPVPREHLLHVFWPDAERPAALQTLRTTLYGLRQALGDALLAENDTVALSPETEVDVRRFEGAISDPGAGEAELVAALDLYRGDFLEDFNQPEAQPFEDWLIVEREHYRRLAVRGLTALSRIYEDRGDYRLALSALDRALAFNPLQEDLQRERMRLLYLAGDRPGAIRRYDELRRLLDEEMGVLPMAETRKLYDAIIQDAEPSAAGLNPRLAAAAVAARPQIPASRRLRPAALPPRTGPQPELLPFVGRAVEMEQLGHLLASGRMVLVEGEPGVGKTRLVEEFLRRTNSLSLTGRARELERNLPYQPVIEALRSLALHPEWERLQQEVRRALLPVWRAEVGRLLPEWTAEPGDLPPPGRAADESRLWEGINQFLLALARTQPVIIFIDDLQWADASSLALLGYLVRRPAQASIRVIATARPAEPRSPLASLLQSLTREDRLAHLPLARLSNSDVFAVARQISPAQPEPLAGWLLRASEGSPFILAELVRYARANGLLDPDGGLQPEALSQAPIVPQTVYTMIQSRLQHLPDEARRVLDAAVAAGREFEFDVVAQAAGLSESAALDGLDELQAAGLVQPIDGFRFMFDHPLTMEVAYREIGELRHRRLHRRVAEVLETIHRGELDQFAGQLAAHFFEGRAPERGAAYARLAGRQAASLAGWTEAAAFFRQSLEGVKGPGRIPILRELGDVYINAGHFVRAVEVLKEAAQLAQDAGEEELASQIMVDLGLALLPQAQYAETIDLARRLLESGRAELAVQAELLWGIALSLEGEDLEGARQHLQQAEALWAEHTPDDPSTLAQIKFEMGSLLAQQGDFHRAIELYHESLDAANRSDVDLALDRRILAYNNLAYHSLLAGEGDPQAFAQRGLELAQEKGAIGLQAYLLSTTGEIALHQGDLERAEQYFHQGLAIAEQLSMPERIAGLTANLGLVAAARGDAGLAVHRLTTALALADALGTRHLAAQVRLWLAPLLPPGEMRLRLAEARQIIERSGRRQLLAELEALESRVDVEE